MPDASLGRRFGRLTALNILANVTVPLASLIDTALLGHLSDIRFLAGVALSAILFEYIYWTFGFLRMGTTGTTAQAVGHGNRTEVYLVLYRSLLLAALIAGAILVLQIPLRELGFALLSGSPGVEAAGRDYFATRIWAAPATLANFAFLGWYLGREESRNALVMTVAGNLANVVLDYIFIVRMGMAAWGAGLATAISQYLMLAVAIAIFFRAAPPLPWRWAAVLDRERVGELFRLNRDILIRTVALITTFALFTNFSSLLGTAVLAANAILLRILMLAAYLIDGAAFATESLAGIFSGDADRESLGRLRRLALVSGLAFTVPFIGVILLAPRAIFGLLTSHAETLGLAISYAPWLVPTLALGSLAFIYDGLFLGLTAGRALRNSMVASTLLVFLPIAFVSLKLGNNHLLWIAMAAWMGCRALTLGYAERRLA